MALPSFIALDKDRQERDRLLQEKLANLGATIGRMPMDYTSLRNAAEDRQMEMQKKQLDLQIKKAEEDRDAGKYQSDMSAAGVELSQNKQALEDSQKAAKHKKIVDFVTANMSPQPTEGEGKEITDDEIAQISKEDPENAEEIVSEYRRQRAERDAAKQKQALETRKLDLRQMDAETRRLLAQKRAARGQNTVARLRPLPVGAAKDLFDQRNKIQILGNALKFKEQEDIDTGPLAGTIQKLRQLSHTQSPKEAVLNQQVMTLVSDELHRLSGATVTPIEWDRLKQLLPSQWDDEDVYEALTQYAMEMASDHYNTLLDTYGPEGLGFSTGKLTHIDSKGAPKNVAPQSNAAPVNEDSRQTNETYSSWSQRLWLKYKSAAKVKQVMGF